jgi:hypothetical protein
LGKLIVILKADEIGLTILKIVSLPFAARVKVKQFVNGSF